MFTGRPWAVRNSKTPSNIARMVANAATSAGNGVMGIGHCQVTALPTPTNKVRILPGIAVFRSQFPGVQYESYIDVNETSYEWPITPTGSDGGRTDYLTVRIIDPQYPGNPVPADRVYGPYLITEVLTTDPRVSKPQYPYVLLAKITQPANNSTITQAMIDSGPTIREMANPLSSPMQLAWNGRWDGVTDIRANELVNMNNVTGKYWLPEATTAKYLRWEVPFWAGQLNFQFMFSNLFNNRYDCWGWCGLRMCDAANPSTFISLPNSDWDTTTDTAGSWSRDTWSGAGRIYVPAWARGKTVEFRPLAVKVGGNQTAAKIYLGAGSAFSMIGNFMQSAADEIL